MHAVDCDTGAGQTPCELVRVHEQRELGLRVRAPDIVAPAQLQIVQSDATRRMRIGADVDHTRGRAGFELVEQQVGEQERRQKVDRHGHLHAIDCFVSPEQNHPRVVDQHMQLRIARSARLGQLAHRRLLGEVGEQEVNRGVAAGGLDVLPHHLSLGLVARDDHDGGALLRQAEGCGLANPRGGSRHQTHSALHASLVFCFHKCSLPVRTAPRDAADSPPQSSPARHSYRTEPECPWFPSGDAWPLAILHALMLYCLSDRLVFAPGHHGVEFDSEKLLVATGGDVTQAIPQQSARPPVVRKPKVVERGERRGRGADHSASARQSAMRGDRARSARSP